MRPRLLSLVRSRRRAAVVTVAVVVLAGGGATAYAVGGDDATGTYRTAAATRADVEEVLSTTGTVDAAKRADADVAVDGTVASVKAAEGQKVAAGDVIAVLDRTSLKADLAQAKADLAKARAQLESDQDAQAETVTESVTGAASGGAPSGGGSAPKGGQQSGGGSPSGPSSPSTPSAPSTPKVDLTEVKAKLAELSQQQGAVTSAQSAASAAIDAASSALSAQNAACREAYQPVPTPTDGSTPTGDTAADDACTAALADVQGKQAAVKDAQQTLSDALDTLNGTLDDAVSALEKAVRQAGGTTSPAAFRTSGSVATIRTVALVTSAPAATPDAGGGSGATGRTITAATLASDQAAIDTARASVLTARRSLQAAAVRAPIGGTVALVDVAAGDDVSAGDPVAVVTAGRGVLVDVGVPETKIRSIAVGQDVRVRTPGSSTTSTGEVTAVGVAADTSSGTATYPVTVAVDAPETTLPAGSSVLVEVVVGTVSDAVTVPTSAVSTARGGTVVQVLRGGVPTAVQVTTGLTGGTRTQVTKGLSAGTRVVLADLDQTVTGASSTLQQNGPGGFGGGQGGPPAGASGGQGGPPTR